MRKMNVTILRLYETILVKERAKAEKWYMTKSEWVLPMKLSGKTMDINIIHEYAMTAHSAEAESFTFYKVINMAMGESKK